MEEGVLEVTDQENINMYNDFPMSLHGVVLNYVSKGKTLPIPLRSGYLKQEIETLICSFNEATNTMYRVGETQLGSF
jgi:hypothetical protein